jgi:hypothetical protein
MPVPFIYRPDDRDICEHGQTSLLQNHNQLRRFRVFLPAIFVFVGLGSLLAWSCVKGMPAGVDLMERALDDNSTSIYSLTRRSLVPSSGGK